MLFWILLAISVLGFGYAAYKDLKTTEFPDWLPYLIIVTALAARAVFSYLYSDWWILLSSLLFGSVFLGAGLLLYYTKQWGDGDGWLLGALGFVYPDTAGIGGLAVFMMPFPVMMLFNFFLISFLYLVVYSITLGIRNKSALRKFFRELRRDSKSLEIVTGVFTVACVILAVVLYVATPVPFAFVLQLFLFPILLLSLLVFIRYGRFVEQNLFRKKINVKDLKLGDVPVDSKWKVMTEKDLARLKKKGGNIWIKEGVRFAPVFIITVLVTLFYGNLFSLFFF